MLLRRTAIVLRPREKGSNKPTGKERMISCYISAGLVPRVLSSRVFNKDPLEDPVGFGAAGAAVFAM